jgi:hypothetical protein
MSTYLPKYKIVDTDQTDLTLYEACKALIAIGHNGQSTDIMHIRRSGRAVAFYCNWTNAIRPMHTATPTERRNVRDWIRIEDTTPRRAFIAGWWPRPIDYNQQTSAVQKRNKTS